MDDQRFDMLMSAITKIDRSVEKLDDRLREVEIMQGSQTVEIKALHSKIDSQFPIIQTNLNDHAAQDEQNFNTLNGKIQPLEKFYSQYQKEIWYHRLGLAALIITAVVAAPGSLSGVIMSLITVIKSLK